MTVFHNVSPAMDFTASLQGADVLVLALQEDHLDASNAREFLDAMRSRMHRRTRIVLDLGAVKFVDGAGIGALIGCLRQAGRQRGDMRLCKLSREVLAMLELMHMHGMFSIDDSCADAVAAFPGPVRARATRRDGVLVNQRASMPGVVAKGGGRLFDLARA
jgi:anti-sigma B factor antagonist